MMLKDKMETNQKGYFGKFGGNFLPDDLKQEFERIEAAFIDAKNDPEFQKELNYLLKYYAGRPSPVYFAKNLSKKYGAEIYFKREDLNHTGAHKINHALGEALLAKRMDHRNNE